MVVVRWGLLGLGVNEVDSGFFDPTVVEQEAIGSCL